VRQDESIEEQKKMVMRGGELVVTKVREGRWGGREKGGAIKGVEGALSLGGKNTA